MDEQTCTHCRLDLHAAQEAKTAERADWFLRKWGAELDALLLSDGVAKLEGRLEQAEKDATIAEEETADLKTKISDLSEKLSSIADDLEALTE